MKTRITSGVGRAAARATGAGAALAIAAGAAAQPTISTRTDGDRLNPTITWTVIVPLATPISSLHIKAPYGADLISTTEPRGWTWTGRVNPNDFANYDWTSSGNVSGELTFSVKLGAACVLRDMASIVQYDVLERDDDDDEWERVYYDFAKPVTPTRRNYAFAPVPTPGSAALLGIAGLAGSRRRR